MGNLKDREQTTDHRFGDGVMVRELSHKKQYQFQAEKGSRVEIEIEAKIKDIDKTDLEEILHEVAAYTHNFYLSLGRKITE